MDERTTLNEILVRLFNEIIGIETRSIIKEGNFKGITSNEIHVVDAIGIKENKNMSTIARELDITVGTLTISINGLEKKGYVKRIRCEEDRRVIFIKLTSCGEALFYRHKEFHNNMIEEVIKTLNNDERKILIKSLVNLSLFFRKQKF